jgi:transcription antitermination factor NusG
MSSAAKLKVSVEPATKVWCLVQTRYRFEKKVADQLTNKGMQVFLPLRKENRSWGEKKGPDRKREMLVPLFPGYTFVRSDRSVLHRLIVLQTAGVMGFVSSAGIAAVVPEKQVDDMQLLIAEEIPLSLHTFAKTGQRARIRGGPLDGVDGLLEQRNKLLISIESIQRSVAIDIQAYEVEIIG